MRNIILTLLTFLLSSISYAQALTGRVVKIADGDTFTLLTADNEQVKVRLDGIDAPEKGQPFANRAKEYLSSMIWNDSTIVVTVIKKDHYGRSVARISTAGIPDVNIEMIKAGFAWHYKDYNSDSAYAEAEIQARENRLGLWQDASPVRPQDYRKERRSKRLKKM